MKAIYKLLIAGVLLPFAVSAQFLPGVQPNAADGLVKWYTLKEAQELNRKTPRPFLIDVYTDWCGWCKHMIKTTYSDPGLANYINTYFYPVKFNAETKDTIEYNGVKYHNESSAPKSPHQLAKKFLGTSLTYPSTIFVNNNFQFNLLTQGYLDVKKMEPLLIYTVENIFRTSSYDDFQKQFSLAFYDSLKQNHPERVKWYKWQEAMELQKKKPKKILVSLYTNWCSGCRVMNMTTFSDSMIAPYLNEKYYLVDLNAESKDTLLFNGQVYTGSTNQGFPFHSIVPVITKNSFVLPSMIFIDEKMQVLESVAFYQHPKSADPIIKYFGDNIYLNTKWDDFIKQYKEKGSKSQSKIPADSKTKNKSTGSKTKASK